MKRRERRTGTRVACSRNPIRDWQPICYSPSASWETREIWPGTSSHPLALTKYRNGIGSRADSQGAQFTF